MIHAQYYFPVFLHLILLLTIIRAVKLYDKQANYILKGSDNMTGVFLLCCFLILFIGLRPLHQGYMGDSYSYAKAYELYQQNVLIFDFNDLSKDWLFDYIQSVCSQIMNVEFFFVLIAAGYIGFTFWGCYRLMKKNVYITMLFCFGAFSFFVYGTNGIRNGLACSILIPALSYITGNNRGKIIASIFCLCAIFIHKSAMLPALCMFGATFYKNTKVIYIFWFSCIFLSLIFDNYFETFFASFVPDERMERNAFGMSVQEKAEAFSSTGYRWDFLLYGFMPVLLGWYVVFKKKMINNQYLLLLHTYVLSNAFWILVNKIAFSNRFAYLSWFIYPIVLAYPLLSFPVWQKRQGKKLALILIAHLSFTYIMWILFPHQK